MSTRTAADDEWERRMRKAENDYLDDQMQRMDFERCEGSERELVELRAYHERTEAALRDLLDWTSERHGKAADEPKTEFIEHLWGFMQDHGLWREQTKENP